MAFGTFIELGILDSIAKELFDDVCVRTRLCALNGGAGQVCLNAVVFVFPEPKVWSLL